MTKISELTLLLIAFTLGWYLHKPDANYFTSITFCTLGWFLGDFVKYVTNRR